MLDKVADIVARCSRAAALTGAGISAESGVPTFRGKEGLWGKFKPEQLATMDAFMASPKIVWEWYNWRRELMSKVSPNPGHLALCDLESLVNEFTLITQNVDNLHRMAGSGRVLELHGNIYRNKCSECGLIVEEAIAIDPAAIPGCAKCGGRIRPDVVWFGELLPEAVIQEAFERAEEAEVFLSVGTSAVVQPAASLPLLARRHGACLIEINPERTPLSEFADFSFQAPSGEVLPQLVAKVRERKGVEHPKA